MYPAGYSQVGIAVVAEERKYQYEELSTTTFTKRISLASLRKIYSEHRRALPLILLLDPDSALTKVPWYDHDNDENGEDDEAD